MKNGRDRYYCPRKTNTKYQVQAPGIWHDRIRQGHERGICYRATCMISHIHFKSIMARSTFPVRAAITVNHTEFIVVTTPQSPREWSSRIPGGKT